MAKPRVFSSSEAGSQAGVYHVVSRFVDRRRVFQDAEREVFRRMMEAFAAFHQVEILTFCLMGNHFHLLIRVPERPDGFDVPLERVMELMDRAVGADRMKVLRSQFRVWEQCGGQEAIEQWRQTLGLTPRLQLNHSNAVWRRFQAAQSTVGKGNDAKPGVHQRNMRLKSELAG